MENRKSEEIKKKRKMKIMKENKRIEVYKIAKGRKTKNKNNGKK